MLEALEDPADELDEYDEYEMDSEDERVLGKGCVFCGGLGHRITRCPKLLKDQARSNPAGRDSMKTADGDW